ncbi:hypothetical protein B0H67DRAFT_592730 [Lasiosphaeris hirsuta]|uniref:Uncharacterized protein n=1 Tax=Lasiosphaeris hirsuta TaxID=260670 RepID=A0AA40DM66_9PEZI|nr:hypothetical protein B0H67DRAFT_592730 [Lasiosphaeris hirsuta]
MSSQIDKGKSKARDPPPALFLPSSPTSSHVSLPGIMASGIAASVPRAPGQTQPASASTSALGRGGPLLRGGDPASSLTSPVEGRSGAGGRGPTMATTTAPPPALNLNLPLQLTRGESTRATDRTDALWAEMQATLEEVELSASGGTRVFGPDHERKLSELRMAQIALAQAWARSEADDAIETISSRHAKSPPTGVGVEGGAATSGSPDGTGKAETGGGTTATAATAATDGGGAKSTAGTGSARPGSSGVGGGVGPERLGAKLEEETEVDILLARKRREANDRYFQRVNQGVLDVVAKLEEVATSMRAVEQESKDIWGDGENDSDQGSGET